MRRRTLLLALNAPLAIPLALLLVAAFLVTAVAGGDVLHALKATDAGFRDFGEAYFSMIEPGAIKAWKMHRRMTLNLVVPIGIVRFAFAAHGAAETREETIGDSNYARLTVPPGIALTVMLMQPSVRPRCEVSE